MDRMAAAGLKVILDIPGQPAPVWLHRKYPGVDIVTQHGVRLDPVERYMDDKPATRTTDACWCAWPTP